MTEQEACAAIDVLLVKGADINVVDERGQGALHGAAYRGWNEVVKHFVALHADLYVKALRGFTPVDTALDRSDGHGRNAGQFIVKPLRAEIPPSATHSCKGLILVICFLSSGFACVCARRFAAKTQAAPR